MGQAMFKQLFHPHFVSLPVPAVVTVKGAFTLANFAHDFALSLHVLLKKFVFITKLASLVRNHPQNCANVNAPLWTQTSNLRIMLQVFYHCTSAMIKNSIFQNLQDSCSF